MLSILPVICPARKPSFDTLAFRGELVEQVLVDICKDRIVFDQMCRIRLDCTVLRAHAFKVFAIIVPDESTAPAVSNPE
jgi:hypothetical protein